MLRIIFHGARAGLLRYGVRGLPHVSLRRLLHIARRHRKLPLPSLPQFPFRSQTSDIIISANNIILSGNRKKDKRNKKKEGSKPDNLNVDMLIGLCQVEKIRCLKLIKNYYRFCYVPSNL